MEKTYEVTDSEEEQSVIETITTTQSKTYYKDVLISKIARLQGLLDKFNK